MAKSKYFSRGLEILKPIIMEQWFHQRWEPLNVCKTHPVLGTPVHHIVTLKKPNNICFEIVQLENIIDVCVYMDTQNSDVQYAAQFPNHYERDWASAFRIVS